MKLLIKKVKNLKDQNYILRSFFQSKTTVINKIVVQFLLVLYAFLFKKIRMSKRMEHLSNKKRVGLVEFERAICEQVISG